MGDISKVKVEPCSVSWGRPNVQAITCVADVSSSLNNDWFNLYSAKNATRYYVWFNVASAGTDPAVSGATGVEVAIAADATAAQVATALASAIDALADFAASANSAVVTVTNAANGFSTAASNGSSSPGFSFAVTDEGAGGDLGFTDGDIEISFTENYTEVTAHQEGTTKLSDIRTGYAVEDVTISLKESSVEQIRDMLVQMGAAMTPSGGTEGIGFGTSKQFSQVLDQAEKLVLHPVALASSNRSRDWAFWLAYPKMDSIMLSPENPMMVNVSFKIYPDSSKDSRVRFAILGDHTQDFSA